mmetsp:Transcript_87950/g.247104  ORF Transcript_87950/g.247104 Transcript_87950/m.247104 type:complete len:291 (-) Transcript_87950:2048-2920(-)
MARRRPLDRMPARLLFAHFPPTGPNVEYIAELCRLFLTEIRLFQNALHVLDRILFNEALQEAAQVDEMSKGDLRVIAVVFDGQLLIRNTCGDGGAVGVAQKLDGIVPFLLRFEGNAQRFEQIRELAFFDVAVSVLVVQVEHLPQKSKLAVAEASALLQARRALPLEVLHKGDEVLERDRVELLRTSEEGLDLWLVAVIPELLDDLDEILLSVVRQAPGLRRAGVEGIYKTLQKAFPVHAHQMQELPEVDVVAAIVVDPGHELLHVAERHDLPEVRQRVLQLQDRNRTLMV